MRINLQKRSDLLQILRRSDAMAGLSAVTLILLCSFLGFRPAAEQDKAISPLLLLHSSVVGETVVKNSLRTSSDAPVLRNTLLSRPGMSAEWVWNQLVEEGSYQITQQQQQQATKTKVGVAMEVGMHRAVQCLQAATAGFQAHCVEPSPVSFQRVQDGVAASPDAAVRQRVHLYPAAASNTSNNAVEFVGTGTTGDHVGEFDMWNMKAGKPEDEGVAKKQGDVIQVPTISLDDIIAGKLTDGEDKAFVIKVDTQGFEPAVLSGLTKSLKAHNVQFLLMEYWPAGMDLIAQKPAGTCLAATLVQKLLDAGYTVYALPASAHPVAPEAARKALNNATDATNTMPTHSVAAHCQWFYDVEKRFPSDEYKMGYWADILAVAPDIQLASSPTTELGKILLA